MATAELQNAIARLVDLLAGADYEEFIATTAGSRITAAELRRAVEEYPFRLVPLPAAELDLGANLMHVDGSEPPASFLDVDLWDETGKSDLTLSLLVTVGGERQLEIEVLDLHVL